MKKAFNTENLSYRWNFIASAISYVPIAADEAILVIALAGMSLSVCTPIALIAAFVLLIIAYNTKTVLRSYPDGASSFYLAKTHFNKYSAVIAAASSLIDYILTVAIMSTYFSYCLISLIPKSIGFHVLPVSIVMLFFAALINYKKIKIPVIFIRSLAVLFFVSILAALSIVIYTQYSSGFIYSYEVPHFSELQRNSTSLLMFFIILRAFSNSSIISIGFDNIRFKQNYSDFNKDLITNNINKGIYILSAIVIFLFLSLVFLAQNLHVTPEANYNLISKIILETTHNNMLLFVTQIFTSLIMFISTCNNFGNFPALAGDLARSKYFPTMFKNTSDEFIFANCILLNFVLSSIIVILIKGSAHNLIALYAIGAFISMSIGQFAIAKKTKKEGVCSIIAYLGGVITLIAAITFVISKYEKGSWVIILFIILLSYFMLQTRKYYTVLEEKLHLDKQKYIEPPQVRNTSVVIITDINKGIIPSITYAKSISKDCRAIYVSVDAEADKKAMDNWEFFSQDIPLVILKNQSKSVIKPILNYIDYAERDVTVGVITVVIPEYIPKTFMHMIYHRNYAFILRFILGFKRGVISTVVPYYLD